EDVFAFGAVVYEMATGRRAFEGTSTAAVIAAIMSGDPPAMAEGRVPATLQWIVRRCLEKNPDLRWQSMQDIAMLLKWTARGSAEHGPQRRPATPAHRTVLLATIGGVLLAGAALGLIARRWPAVPGI